MAKGVTDTTKFVRAVLAQEIRNPVNQSYTAGTAALPPNEPEIVHLYCHMNNRGMGLY